MPALLAEAELTANWKLSLLEYVKAQAAAGVIGAASTLPSLIQPVIQSIQVYCWSEKRV